MSEGTMICRLCMSERYLKDLFKLDEICAMITSVIGVKLQQGDSLPSVICVPCERNVKYFNRFKQTCLEVDLKLREKFLKPITTSNDCVQDETISNMKLENENMENWLAIHTKNNINMKLENGIDDLEYKDYSFVQQKQEKDKDCNKNEKVEKKFQCDVCGNIYKNKCSLKTHITTHTGVKKYSCPICSKMFTRAAHKVVHMRAHMGIKPFICEICGMSTTKRQDLNRHLRVHSDEKKYSCPECDKRFKRSSDVRTHLRAHTLARPYKCIDCDKSYKSHGALQKHFRTHSKKEQKEKETNRLPSLRT